MKKLIILLIFIPHFLFAQNYKQLTDSALHVMNNAQDSAAAAKAYPLAYALYQRAFKEFPSQVEKTGLYKAGYLAGELGKKDEAFDYLGKAIDAGNYTIVTWKYAREEFSRLVNDARWLTLVKKGKLKQKNFIDSLKADQQKLEDLGILHQLDLDKYNAEEAYYQIKKYDSYPIIKKRLLSMQFPFNDTLHSAFLIVLPANYDPHRSYALLFFLHGAVSSNSGYLDYVNDLDTRGWNRFYTKYANDVIMIYPHGNADYNWMYPDKGFYMVPTILKQIKQIINIDDNRVFITGHSNGATGSFSYLMKQQSPFTAFYGFNTRPRVQTGGTYIKNILNRSYFNVSTDQDYYYPPGANDSLTAVMKSIGADYQDHRYNGFPHWFPQFDESEPAYKLLFEDLAKRKRNPFHSAIYWECDDVKYGRCDWMEITALDTLSDRVAWQRNINFKINKWTVLDDKNKGHVRDTSLNAFKYLKRSGAVKASYNKNVFSVETSDIKSFSLLISPEMVDLTKPITVIVNGKRYNKVKLNYDKDFMLADFKNNLDRSAIWVNHIDVNLP
jgi:predicted esterase